MQVILAVEEQAAPPQPDRQPFVMEAEQTKKEDTTGMNPKHNCTLSESEVSAYFSNFTV